jgi:hypothetical protein
LLRGRTRDEILAGLRARRAGDSAELLPAEAPASEPDAAEGMDARAAFARTPAPLPLLPLPPTRPGRPSALAVDPPPGAVRAEDLYALAADAAARAVELLSAGGDAALSLTEDEDVVRRAAALLGSRGYDAFAKRAGIAPRALARRALAWQLGGRGALAVLDDEWAPDYADLAEGVAALGAGSHVSRNRVSDASDSKQLRLGRDGLWYPMRRVGGAWEISAPPSADPRALTARAG